MGAKSNDDGVECWSWRWRCEGGREGRRKPENDSVPSCQGEMGSVTGSDGGVCRWDVRMSTSLSWRNLGS